MKCQYNPEIEMIPLRPKDLRWLKAKTVVDKNPEHWRVCPKCNTVNLLPEFKPKLTFEQRMEKAVLSYREVPRVTKEVREWLQEIQQEKAKENREDNIDDDYRWGQSDMLKELLDLLGEKKQ